MMKEKTTKINKKLGVVFGHKLGDMAHAVSKLERDGLDVWIITWDRYKDNFSEFDYTIYSQPTPELQGMDCMNLVLASKDLLFSKVKKERIKTIINCHTIPSVWDFDLTTKEWKELFNFEAHKDYVDDVIQRRYKNR